MLIELAEGFYVDPEFVAVVKATGKDTCALFIPGQSAVDGGFTIDYPAYRVVRILNEEPDDDDEDGQEGEG